MTALTLTAWTPAVTDAADSAAGGVQVVVDGRPGSAPLGGVLTNRAASAASDVGRMPYPTTDDPAAQRSGLSASGLARRFGVPPAAVETMTVSYGPQTIALSGAEVADGFGDGRPALFFADSNFDPGTGEGTEVRFIRPLVALTDGGPQDISPPGGGTLQVTIAADVRIFRVAAHGPGGRLARGEQASFGAASATEPDATYSWEFGDGGPGASGSAPTRAYVRDGSYLATVTASAPDGGVGLAQVPVEVGDPAPAPQQPEQPSAPGPGGGGGGVGDAGGVVPSAGGGGRATDGAATGPSGGRGGGGSLRAGRGAGGGGARGSDSGARGAVTGGGTRSTPRTPGGGSGARPSSPPPAVAAPRAPSAPAGGSAGSGSPSAGSDDGASDPAEPPAPTATPDAATGAGAGGAGARRAPGRGAGGAGLEQVDGLLLASAGVTPRELAQLAAGAAAPRPVAARPASGDGGQPARWWLAAVAAIALLVGTGVARESGALRALSIRPR